MNMLNIHPDDELLDRLRAGLLDDEPALKAKIETHLGQCASCRKRYNGSGHLHPGKLAIDTPTAQLDRFRQLALGATARPSRRLPYAIAVALALVAVVLIKPALQDDPATTRLAQTPPEATPVLYENLDFYLWLADHKGDADSTS